jgi:ribosomal-protein-alanine N-acetyltransferase
MTTNISFKPFPELNSRSIILRRLKYDDKIELSRLRSDDRVNEFLKRPGKLSEDSAGELVDKLNAGIDKNDWIIWAVTLPGAENLIGTICLWNLDKEYSLAEIGFELMPEHQKKGIMSEAIKLVLDYAFNEMKIARIEGFTNDKNLRAFSLMEKSGFVRDTDLENEIRINEPDFVNMVAYKLEK